VLRGGRHRPMMAALTDAATIFAGQATSLLDVGDTFVVPLLLKIAFVLGLFFVVPLVGGYLEHKAMGRMQNRRGPVEAGPAGSLQLVADRIKFVQKEDVIASAADKFVFAMAPGGALVPALPVALALP